jgi:tRNA (cytidine/uridine-2'-O-)-methyltransferase
MRLALFQPDIPQNLGAALRLTACMAVPLDVIEPCAFPLNDKSLKRAALDYGQTSQATLFSGWAAFMAAPARNERRPGAQRRGW